MKQRKTSHRKIAPGIETTKKQSLQISISSLNRQVVIPHPWGRGGGRKTGNNLIIVKIVRSPSLSWMRESRGSSEHGITSSNPTASAGVDRGQTGPCKTSVFWGPSATRKTTRFSVRDPKCKRRTTPCTEPAWALQTAQAIGQKCENPKAAKRVESRK